MHRVLVLSLLLLVACDDPPRTNRPAAVPDPEVEAAPREGVVFVTGREGGESNALVRVHPIGDLTCDLPDDQTPGISHFIPPRLVLTPAGAVIDEDQPLFGKKEEGADHRMRAEDLLQFIVRTIEPGSWEGGGYAISVSGGNKLVVVHTPEVQARVARFLNSLR